MIQSIRIVQAVILLSVVAAGAGCAASKEYTSKLFTPRIPVEKDSRGVALRFLELDQLNGDDENWVTTDIINGRDTTSGSIALDRLSQTFPAKADTVKAEKEVKSIPTPNPVMARNGNPGEVRSKKVRKPQ